MARFLAIDWDHGQLRVVLANIKHGGVQVLRAIAWPEERGPNPAEAEAMGQRLKERLRAAGIAAAPVLACIGRDRVILKEVRHPAVAAAEEPALVRFQTIKELSDAPAEVIIDYVPAGNAGSDRKALAVVLRRELAAAYQALCRAAGLKLAGLCPRPFGTAACVGLQAGRDAIALLVSGDKWAEFSIVQNGRLLLTRSLSTPLEDADLLGEIRRNLAVHAGQNPAEPVRALHVSDDRLGARLQDKLAIPVRPLDPFAGLRCDAVLPDPRGPFAGAVGLLRAWVADKALPINFTQPREPKPAGTGTSLKVLVGVAASIMLLVGLGVAAWLQLDRRDSEIHRLTLERLALDGQLVRINEDAARIDALADWHGRSVVWLDELYDLTQRVPDHSAMRVTNLTADLTAATTKVGKDKAKDKCAGKIVLRGVSSDKSGVVDNLVAQMVRDGSYRVGASQWSQNVLGLERFRFNQQFITPIEIEPRKPEFYVRRLPPPRPPERRPPPPPDDGIPLDLGELP